MVFITSDSPRATRSILTQAVLKSIKPLRMSIGHHLVHQYFDEIALFSSYLRWESTMIAYLYERCLRQFDYMHDIPQYVLIAPFSVHR